MKKKQQYKLTTTIGQEIKVFLVEDVEVSSNGVIFATKVVEEVVSPKTRETKFRKCLPKTVVTQDYHLTEYPCKGTLPKEYYRY